MGPDGTRLKYNAQARLLKPIFAGLVVYGQNTVKVNCDKTKNNDRSVGLRLCMQTTQIYWMNIIFCYIHENALLFNCCSHPLSTWTVFYILNTPWSNIFYVDTSGKLMYVFVFVVILNMWWWFFPHRALYSLNHARRCALDCIVSKRIHKNKIVWLQYFRAIPQNTIWTMCEIVLTQKNWVICLQSHTVGCPLPLGQ